MKIQRNLTSIALSILTLSAFSLSLAGAESGIKNRQIFVGTSARALGMGGAFTAGPASSNSPFWNPSSLGFLNATELSLLGLPFTQASGDREGAFSLALNPQQLGIAATNVGNVSISSWFGGWGDDSERDRMMLVGYGISLGKEIAAGANIRHYRHTRSIRKQLGLSFDLGARFARKLERHGDRIAFGLTFEDLGGHIWENGQLTEKMSSVTRLGTTYALNQNTVLSGDFVWDHDRRIEFEERLRTHLGVERWLFKKQFGLRLGYTAITNTNRLTEGEWSTGWSLRTKTGQLDYAYVRGSELDGAMHWIAATLRWGGRDAEPPMSQPPLAEEPTPAPTQPAPIVMPKQIFSVLHLSETAISPNGDGVKDQTTFDFEIAKEDAWQLEIHNEANRGGWGDIVQRYSGTGPPSMEIVWAGQDDAGNRVSDGTYTAQWFTLDDKGNRQLQREATITVDTTPASLELSAESLIFAPADPAASSGEKVLNMPTVHVQASDLNPLARWELQFFNEAGERLEHLGEDGEPPDTIVWNNWREDLAPKASTTAPSVVGRNIDWHCVLTVHDIAGNRSTQSASFSVLQVGDKEPGDTQGTIVEAPREEKQEASNVVLALSGVAFERNAYEIKPEYRPTLEKIAQTIAAHPDAQVAIEGHTDNSGSASYNLELSQKRANAVMTYLVEEFQLNPARLSATGYGEERPIAPNDTEDNRQKNRRVAIVLSTETGFVRLPLATLLNPSVAKGAPMETNQDSQDFQTASDDELRPSDTPDEGSPIQSFYPENVHIDASGKPPKYALLVGSFKNRENAESLFESLKGLELGEVILLEQVTAGSESWYRVTIGGFHNRKDGTGLISQMVERGIKPIVVSVGEQK